MYGEPTTAQLQAFEQEVGKAVSEAVAQVAARHGLGNQVIVVGGSQPNTEAADALETLQRIRELVNGD